MSDTFDVTLAYQIPWPCAISPCDVPSFDLDYFILASSRFPVHQIRLFPTTRASLSNTATLAANMSCHRFCHFEHPYVEVQRRNARCLRGTNVHCDSPETADRQVVPHGYHYAFSTDVVHLPDKPIESMSSRLLGNNYFTPIRISLRVHVESYMLID